MGNMTGMQFKSKVRNFYFTLDKVYTVTPSDDYGVVTVIDDYDNCRYLTRSYLDYHFDEVKGALKDTNPKDAVGIKKYPLSTVSAPVLAEVGAAMLEGARKYGRHNYRVSGVRSSVYYDASMRHLFSWWEGEDLDPDSGVSHVTKAIASLVVLRDAMMQDKMIDDRPPASKQGWQKEIQKAVDDIFDRLPESKEAHTNELHAQRP